MISYFTKRILFMCAQINVDENQNAIPLFFRMIQIVIFLPPIKSRKQIHLKWEKIDQKNGQFYLLLP
jgi:hypothetical protein